MPIAAGLDTRLIEAEAKLQAGDYPDMMTALITTPSSKATGADLRVCENAFWQFGRGVREPARTFGHSCIERIGRVLDPNLRLVLRAIYAQLAETVGSGYNIRRPTPPVAVLHQSHAM